MYDEVCTVCPFKGSGVLTGSEYLLALKQKCKLTIHKIYYILSHKELNPEGKELKPFREIIDIVQKKRQEHLEDTIT